MFVRPPLLPPILGECETKVEDWPKTCVIESRNNYSLTMSYVGILGVERIKLRCQIDMSKNHEVLATLPVKGHFVLGGRGIK